MSPHYGNADLIIVNGKVVTVDIDDSVAETVAVKEGVIVKVGSEETKVLMTIIGGEVIYSDLA